MSNLLLLRRRLHNGSLSSRLNQIRRYALIGKPSQNQKPIWSLPESPARTRFAPSPTGYLHLGSLRTALFCYLLAQATGGQFIIRLEDTDQTRFVDDAESRLYQDLQWAGLTWDEGPDNGGPFGPYKQSERLDLYRQHVDMLLEKDRAFRCFCTKEELQFNLQQATSLGAVAHYPGTCTHISKSESDRRAANGEPHVVRFKTSEVPVSAPDLVYGAYKKAEREDNFIIMKTDGFPTYHLANVVDDHFMKITHIIRGAEWLISTPKHFELYNAFGWQPPNYAHVGLLVDHQRQKLSKRDIDNIGISVFRDANIMPEALLNFSVLLGWDPSLQNRPHLDKRGRMTPQEMKDNFTLKFTRGDIVVDLAKLKFFQTRYTRDLISGAIPDPSALSHRILKPMQSELERLSQDLSKNSASELVAEVIGNVPKMRIRTDIESKLHTEEYIHEVLKASKGLVESHRQFIRDNLYAFWQPSTLAYKNSFEEFQSGMRRIKMARENKNVLNIDISKVLLHFRNKLDELTEEEWTSEKVGVKAKELADCVTLYNTEKDLFMEHGVGWKFLRWGLFVGMPGLSVVPAMVLLGKQETLARLRKARKCARVLEERLAAAANKAANLQELSRLHSKATGHSAGEGQKSTNDQVSEPRNVKVKIHREEPTGIPDKAKGVLRSIHPESHLPEKGPFVSKPQLRLVNVPKPQDRPPRPISFEEFRTGSRHILSEEQPGPARKPPSKRSQNRAKPKSARRSEPADEINPFAPGGSFFAPEPETRTRSRQPESTRPQNPPGSASRTLQPEHTKAQPGPFQPMSDSERRLHYQHLILQKAYDKKRQASAAQRLEPDDLKPGAAPGNAPGPVGAFYAGPLVDHPLRRQKQGEFTRGDDQRPLQAEPNEGRGAEVAELEQKVKESWVERGRSKGANNTN